MKDTEVIIRLQGTVERLSRQLGELRRRHDIAAIIMPLVSDVTRSRDDHDVLIDDILRCWQTLPPSVRERYLEVRRHTPLEAFAGDYVEAVDWQAARHPEPAGDSPAAQEHRAQLGWLHHLSRIRYQLASGSPPEVDWLERFPFSGE